jgi:uridine kinase
MPHDGVLIVDGVFALRPQLSRHWDLRLWVDIDPELSLRRGIDRDAAQEGTDEAETLHRDRYGTAETIYIAEVDPMSIADVVIDNTDFENPHLVRR